MAGLPPGIKNWHWRTKGVEAWSKEWFTSELTGKEVNGVAISEVTDVEGDSEVGMRKSKLVTIYDVKISMKWTVKDSDINGTLTALEVAHDMDEDEYIFESSCLSNGKEADAFNKIAKKDLANLLRPIFQKYPKAMIDTHGKDLLSEGFDDTPSGSGATTPATASSSTPAVASVAAAAKKAEGASSGPGFNTAVVKAEGEFACEAKDLFEFLTDEKKIPLWTRNPATMKPEVGAEMKLFGGNIAGKVSAVKAPTSITTSWRAPTWPENYHGSLEMTLDQGSSSTTLKLRLSGVPVGKEDEAERNLNVYYITGLKQIGYASSLPSPSTAPATSFVKPSTPLNFASAKSKPSTSRTKRASTSSKAATVPQPWSWTSAVVPSVAAVAIGVAAAYWFGPSSSRS